MRPPCASQVGDRGLQRRTYFIPWREPGLNFQHPVATLYITVMEHHKVCSISDSANQIHQQHPISQSDGVKYGYHVVRSQLRDII